MFDKKRKSSKYLKYKEGQILEKDKNENPYENPFEGSSEDSSENPFTDESSLNLEKGIEENKGKRTGLNIFLKISYFILFLLMFLFLIYFGKIFLKDIKVTLNDANKSNITKIQDEKNINKDKIKELLKISSSLDNLLNDNYKAIKSNILKLENSEISNYQINLIFKDLNNVLNENLMNLNSYEYEFKECNMLEIYNNETDRLKLFIELLKSFENLYDNSEIIDLYNNAIDKEATLLNNKKKLVIDVLKNNNIEHSIEEDIIKY